ncbi:MAG: ADOP family duplicated permease [Acidobacteriota bacterium]
MIQLRHALRCLWLRPVATGVSVLALAAGLGVNVAAFTIAWSQWLRPLPVPEGERLVSIVSTRLDDGGVYGVAYHNAAFWRDHTASLDAVAVHRLRSLRLGDRGLSERLESTEVDPSWFEVVGVSPKLGRPFGPADIEGLDPVVILGDDVWNSHLGGDPDVLGTSVVLDGVPHTVVGVMPAGEDSSVLGWRQLWLPLRIDEAASFESPVWGFGVLARLADGVAVEAAQEDLDGVAAHLASLRPDLNDGWGALLQTARERATGDQAAPMGLLLAASLLVLLVACGTVANLRWAVAEDRRREAAVRRALGAGPSQLLVTWLAEGLLLTAASAALGLGLAAATLGALSRGSSATLLQRTHVDLGPAVLGWAAVVAIVSGLLATLLPGRAFFRAEAGNLRTRGNGQGPGQRLTGHALVSAQTALAVLAVIGSGLLVHSLAELRSVDPGFNPAGLLTTRVEVPDDTWADTGARIQAYRLLLADLRSLPGVDDAASSGMRLPLTGGHGTFELFVEGQPRGPRPDVIATAQMVSPGYFDVLGIPILRGRGFGPEESWDAHPTAVVNETFASRYWPGRDPVGRWIEWSSGDRAQVVGVAADVRQLSIRHLPDAEVYLSWGSAPHSQALVLRTSLGAPTSLLPEVRRRVGDWLPGAAMFQAASGAQMVERSLAREQLAARLMTLFATLALALGLLGLYGVVTHGVIRRRREIGVRLAVGARPSDIFGRVVARSLVPVAAGMAVGALLAAWTSPSIEGLLYGVGPSDPGSFALGLGLVLATATVVAALPARRASRVDPAEVLASD